MNLPAASVGLRVKRRAGEALRLVLDNDIAAIDAGRREIREWLVPARLSAGVTHRWEVVFEEVVSNIVRHGFDPGSPHTIVVDAIRTPEMIQFTFDDDGRPFDPLSASTPEPFRSLETAALGGLGLTLVRRLSAALSYERDPDQSVAADPAAPGFRPRNRLRVSIATDG
jgi:serine/threonine-protein kinase RsbW